MKKFVLFLVCVVSTMFASAQSDWKEVVYLKNGSIVRGVIIEQVPNVSLKIQTADGSLFVFDFADVEKITKELAVSPNSYNIESSKTVSEKSPGLAGFLSFLVPGIGQFYNGESGKGWSHMGVYLGSWAVCCAGMGMMNVSDYDSDEALFNTGLTLFIAGGVCSIVDWISSICDARSSAKRINAENGYVTFMFNKNYSLGLQPALTYERPQYMTGTKSELATGMNVRLTF